MNKAGHIHNFSTQIKIQTWNNTIKCRTFEVFILILQYNKRVKQTPNDLHRSINKPFNH